MIGNSQEKIIGGVRKKVFKHHWFCFLKDSKDFLKFFGKILETLEPSNQIYNDVTVNFKTITFRWLVMYIRG